MKNELSTAKLDSQLSELTQSLSGGDWDDEVKNSYIGFVNEEKTLASNIGFLVDKANSLYSRVLSEDPTRFMATYSECLAKIQRLQRGN